MAGTPVDDESIVGDECHIVSAVSTGPRHDPEFPREKLNDHANLLLLCKVHHKLIDDQSIGPRPPQARVTGANEQRQSQSITTS